MYEALEPGVELAALDREILARWETTDPFARSLAQTEGGEQWNFYEGPPTANGMPGTHHVEARAFKDAFPRFKTMKGYHVPRRAGWDCHGLPVELEVEKRLGLTTKQDIEDFGIAEFNAHCRESVLENVDAFERMSARMGYWADYEHAYHTMDAAYIDSLWWALKQIHDKGLLVEDYRVAPFCPRCETALSSHELGQPGAYVDVTSPSVYVRFPLTSGDWSGNDLLVWTTTPWTLISNTAVAAHPEVTYVLVRHADEERGLVVGESLVGAALGDGWEIIDRKTGRELERATYTRPFNLVDIPDAHYVVNAEFVTTEDGTGLVHLAPAFGADDLIACRAYDLPVVNPVRPDGTFVDDIPMVGGMHFLAADEPLVEDLRTRGVLQRHLPYEHPYPHCWRCHQALIYYAMPSWYIRTTAIKDRLIAENEATTWYPPGIKHGRYGDWLSNNVDWALSRSRYWGTPLPVWRCEDNHVTVIGSRVELGALAGRDLSELDPHRPFVDEITFACPECAKPAARVNEVIDVWFDSGAMPFAQFGAPFTNDDEFKKSYPAQFICEAIDQTRGWFYTLMAVGTLLFDRSSYESVLCLGLLLDAEGRKMSKHVGNVLEPVALMDRHGADAVRWYMLASGSPWSDRRIGHEAIDEIVRTTLLTYWNTVAFQTLYGRAANWSATDLASAPSVDDRHVLDRWLLSELASLTETVDAALEDFDVQLAGRHIAQFIDDISNWYVRRSRRRFWIGETGALATLHEALETLTRLMAPLVPFITERVWQALTPGVGAPDSVHLATWPEPRPGRINAELRDQMQTVRRLVEVGRAARAGCGVKTRQPLSRALIAAPGWDALPEKLRAEIAEELNVLTLETMGAGETLVDYAIKPQFRAIGARFDAQTQAVAQAIRTADAATTAATLRSDGKVELVVDGAPVTLTADEIEITETPREGWYVATDAGLTVALDLEITPELRQAGVARDVVRMVQQARKDSGLEITDRISLWWQADDEVAEAIRHHAASIASEVLATMMIEEHGPADLAEHGDPALGASFRLARAHAG